MFSLKKNGELEAIVDDHYLNYDFGAEDYSDFDIDENVVGQKQIRILD